MPKSTKSSRVNWEKAPDIQKRLEYLVRKSDAGWVNFASITCFRSYNSKARAYARIWGLSRVWQLALKQKPHYIIEVLAERFDDLRQSRKDEVLLHELAHIPKNFSGALVPHYRKGKHKFNDKVDDLVAAIKKK